MKIKRLEILDLYKETDKCNKKICKVKLNFKNLYNFQKQLFWFPNLQILEMFSNNINSIPPEISKLTRLKELLLSGNNIKEIPVELYELKNLEKLSLNGNPIKSISSDIKNLKKLNNIQINYTNITTLPNELFELPNIQKIKYHQSLFSDSYIYITNSFYLNKINFASTIKYIYNDFAENNYKIDVKKVYDNLPIDLKVLFCFGHLESFNNLPINLKRMIVDDNELKKNIDIKLPFGTELSIHKI